MTNYNSELITWSNAFSCGITVIDEQHKELIKMINSLFLHITGNQEMERHYFCMVTNDIINCFKIHLATEEKILNATKYPGYTQHKRAHKTFIVTLLDIIEDYKAGKHHNLTIISKYLKNWALSHIAIMDKTYFEYVKKAAACNPDEILSTAPNDILLKKAC